MSVFFVGLISCYGLIGLNRLLGLRGLIPTNPINPTMPITTPITSSLTISMSLIRNSSPCSIPLLPVLSCLVHFLLDAALLQEVFLLPFDESFDEHITLMNQRDGNIGNGLI